MKQSAIGWCDYSGGNLNFVTGCTPVSAGCANCYARSIYERFGKDFSKVQVHPDKLARLAKMRFGVPVHLNNGAVEYVSPKRGPGYKPMAFVVDTGDLFHEDVPDRFLDAVFNVLEERDDVIWQVLTKRAERMARYVSLRAHWDTEPLPPHVWVGVTVENQKSADERVPFLLDTLAAVRFVSCEPLLERISILNYLEEWRRGWHDTQPHPIGTREKHQGALVRPGIDWCIVGAESGANRRRFDVEWADYLRHQCRATHTAFFGKQDSGGRPGVPLRFPALGDATVQEWPA